MLCTALYSIRHPYGFIIYLILLIIDAVHWMASELHLGSGETETAQVLTAIILVLLNMLDSRFALVTFCLLPSASSSSSV